MARSTPLWQKLIWTVMFLVVFEGAVRKWVMPSFQAQIYLVKDALLVLAYVEFISSRLPTGIHLRAMAGLSTLLLLSLGFFGMEVLNPNSPSIVLSIVGFKNYLLYAPLAFIVPYMFSSSKDLEHKLSKYAIMMIPFAAFGLVQFSFGSDHWINSYVTHDPENERALAMFGVGDEKARTSGTFAYPGGYTTFLTVTLYLGLGLAGSKNWRLSGNLCSWTLIVVTIGAIFSTGSRGPYASVITAPVVLYIWGTKGIMSTGNVLKVGLAAMFISIIVTFIASGAMEAYQFRAAHSEENPIDRMLAPLTEAYAAVAESPIIGTGMASTHGSAVTITGAKDYWWLQGKFFEQEGARVLQETGIIGFILVYAARIWLLVKAISLGVRFRTPLYVAMAGVIAGFFAQYLFLFVINNPTAGVYYWFAAGLLFAMYRLELQEATAPLPASAPRRRLGREEGARRPAPT